MGDRSFYLFARPSFIEGAARLLDWGGTMNEYNSSPDGATADVRALRNDWRAVGDDLSEAYRQCRTSLEGIADEKRRR